MRGAALLLVLVALTAGAKPMIDARSQNYAVSGASEAELRAALERVPPGPHGRPRVGYTQADIRWQYEARERKGRCLVVSVTVTLTAVTTLPRWDAPADAPAELRQRWTAFLDALTLHEQGHFDIALAAAKRIEDALWRAPAPRSCDGYREQLDAMANAMFDEAEREQEAFDRATDYGRTQGVAFP